MEKLLTVQWGCKKSAGVFYGHSLIINIEVTVWLMSLSHCELLLVGCTWVFLSNCQFLLKLTPGSQQQERNHGIFQVRQSLLGGHNRPPLIKIGLNISGNLGKTAVLPVLNMVTPLSSIDNRATRNGASATRRV